MRNTTEAIWSMVFSERSTSSSRIAGSLPPSSSVMPLMVSAALAMMWRADGIEPVNATLPTPGWPVRVSPISPGRPVTRPIRPLGNRSAISSTQWVSASGQVSGGLTITALPASSAGMICMKPSGTGAFQGTIETTTP